MSLEKITIPDLGDSADVEVIEILVSPGDEIQENDSLLVLETDKAAMEIPATSAGVVKEVLVKVGDTVNQGHEIIVIESVGSVSADDDSDKDSAEKVKETAVESEAKVEQPITEQNVASQKAEEQSSKTSKESVADIVIPDLGSDDAVEVIDVIVAVGDKVTTDQGLLTLETDKAAMDVPAPFNGKITDIMVKVGDKVTTGTVIMRAEAEAGGNVKAESTPATKIESNSTADGVKAPQSKP